MNQTIKTAITIVGSQKALGEACAVSAAVYKWLQQSERFSGASNSIVKATGGEIKATRFALICRRCSRHRPTITPPNRRP
jgi:DNA-binding transcriptional regulator YdaS (Cro superfamily)